MEKSEDHSEETRGKDEERASAAAAAETFVLWRQVKEFGRLAKSLPLP